MFCEAWKHQNQREEFRGWHRQGLFPPCRKFLWSKNSAFPQAVWGLRGPWREASRDGCWETTERWWQGLMCTHQESSWSRCHNSLLSTYSPKKFGSESILTRETFTTTCPTMSTSCLGLVQQAKLSLAQPSFLLPCPLGPSGCAVIIKRAAPGKAVRKPEH